MVLVLNTTLYDLLPTEVKTPHHWKTEKYIKNTKTVHDTPQQIIDQDSHLLSGYRPIIIRIAFSHRRLGNITWTVDIVHYWLMDFRTAQNRIHTRISTYNTDEPQG